MREGNRRTSASCTECRKPSSRENYIWEHPLLGVALCTDCRRGQPEKYGYITQTRARVEYRLQDRDLQELGSIEADNPHYKKAAPMRLFALAHVREASRRKWGAPEPYSVTLVDFSDEALAWFLNDPERLKQVSPERFQYLIADRLGGLGLDVQLVGDVYRKDGGVDIVAYPKPSGCAFPFLLAVQVKHHRTPRKTGSGEVRDFHGVLTSRTSPFHMGMIVTNTAFSPDARWFAAQNQALLRLRDLEDLRRWLQSDFANEAEWKEIPEEVELARGIRIVIPRPRLLLPSGRGGAA